MSPTEEIVWQVFLGVLSGGIVNALFWLTARIVKGRPAAEIAKPSEIERSEGPPPTVGPTFLDFLNTTFGRFLSAVGLAVLMGVAIAVMWDDIGLFWIGVPFGIVGWFLGPAVQYVKTFWKPLIKVLVSFLVALVALVGLILCGSRFDIGGLAAPSGLFLTFIGAFVVSLLSVWVFISRSQTRRNG